MLKGINPLLSADLLQVLAEMGHGDDLVIADANFPAVSTANATPQSSLVYCKGLTTTDVLDAVLDHLPVDTYTDNDALIVMEVVPGDTSLPEGQEPAARSDYRAKLTAKDEFVHELKAIERFAFYERAKKAYCVVATSDRRLYANIIVKKGVVKPSD